MSERKHVPSEPAAEIPVAPEAAAPQAHAEPDVDRARRKLLTALVYAAPLVVSTVIVKPVHAQAASCGPASCRPGGGPCGPSGCPPNGGPCGPAFCPPRT